MRPGEVDTVIRERAKGRNQENGKSNLSQVSFNNYGTCVFLPGRYLSAFSFRPFALSRLQYRAGGTHQSPILHPIQIPTN